MEAYQPLNTYSYCQTSRKQESKLKHIKSETNMNRSALIVKAFISVLAIIVIVIATVFVKIEAKEPVSTVAAAGEIKVVIGSGDTLWKLASTHYLHVEDTGYAIYLIKERNGLNDITIYPGQSIILPVID